MTETKNIVLIPGHGIGPEITKATQRVLEALKAPVRFIEFPEPLDSNGQILPELIEEIRKCGVALKGPLATPIGEGYESINVRLRREFNLFANVRPVRSWPGIPTPYQNIDLVVIRENTEGLYSGVELPPTVARERIRDPRIPSDAAVSCHVASPKACRRIAEYAFQYAHEKQRQRVSIIHKANIQKLTDGMFLRISTEVAKKYPDIAFESLLVDNEAHLLVKNLWRHSRRFDVLLCNNHHGDILSDLTAGFIGGLGLAPSAQYGRDIAIFEAVHGTAPDIAGKDLANPTALMLSAALMLKHLDMSTKAVQLESAIETVLSKGKKWRTRDVDGDASTSSFTDSIIQKLQ